jgi:fatty acid desaturase
MPTERDFRQTNRRRRLCLSFRFVLVLFALRLELGVLLWSQDLFRFLHVLNFTRFRATRFVMLGHDLVHLRLLIRREVQSCERDRACRLSGVAGLLCAIAVFTPEHRARCKHSRY